MPTLTAVTTPEPKRRVSRSLSRLETMVPTAMIMETPPAKESGTPNSPYTVGQAEPSSESGSPRLIKDRYITASIRFTTAASAA